MSAPFGTDSRIPLLIEGDDGTHMDRRAIDALCVGGGSLTSEGT
jgi:hypothetical protein